MSKLKVNRKILIVLAACSIATMLSNCSNSINPSSVPDLIESYNTSLEIKSFNPFDSTIDCDYLIITDIEFLNPSLKLAEYRRTFAYDEVLSPRVLLTSTIDSNYAMYFNNSQISTIKVAIKSVETNWKFKPKFIVLFADAQIKPRLYSGIPIPDSSLFADLYYADIDSNQLADVVLGRIPISTKTEADNYVFKIMNFEANVISKMLVIIDDQWQGMNRGYINFDQSNQTIYSYLSSLSSFNLLLTNYRLANFSLPDTLPLTSVQKEIANNALIDSLNSKNKIVTYLGHANYQFLTDEHILTVYDLEKLKTIDLWVSLGCNSNQYRFEDSFAKQLLRMPNAGAVAFIAPYLLGYQYSGERMIMDFYNYLFNDSINYSAGEAFTLATKEQFWRIDGGYFAYLGDPALLVRH